MKKVIYFLALDVLCILLLSSCDGALVGSSHVTDPNGPSVQQVQTNATKAQVQNLITGLEIRNRQWINFGIPLLTSLGRQAWFTDTIESRFLTEWLGIEGDAETNPAFFSDADLYGTPYEAIEQANLILMTLKKTDNLSTKEKNDVRGFAKTIKGFQFLIPLLSQFKNGIRVDVSDPQNLGPFLSYSKALRDIRDILDDGYEDLQKGRDRFYFHLSKGFDEFSDPKSMAELNRAIAAKAAIYAKDWKGALSSLSKSEPFFELSKGSDVLNKGAYYSFGNPPDTQNPLFYPRNATPDQILVVHPSVISDTTAGDLRIDQKFFRRSTPISNPNLPVDASYQGNRFSSVTSPIPMLRNEELVLIYAEAKTQVGGSANLQDAVNAINIIRNTWNLTDYSGPVTKKALINEILYQRRYSLWGSGQRWIDMRRYDRLDSISKNDKIVGKIFKQFARPQSELNL